MSVQDFKASNMLMVNDQLKAADFGISKRLKSAKENTTSVQLPHPVSGIPTPLNFTSKQLGYCEACVVVNGSEGLTSPVLSRLVHQWSQPVGAE